jgi:hypothetical protein
MTLLRLRWQKRWRARTTRETKSHGIATAQRALCGHAFHSLLFIPDADKKSELGMDGCHLIS